MLVKWPNTKVVSFLSPQSLSKCQIDGEDFVNFCGLLKKYELYKNPKLFKLSQTLQMRVVNKVQCNSENKT